MANGWVRVAFRFGTASSLLIPLVGYGAGLGSIHVLSGLGQPLHATLALTGVDTTGYNIECARIRLESIEGTHAVPARVELVSASGAPALRIRTDRPVNELALNVVAVLECGAAIARSYQILLDPVAPALAPLAFTAATAAAATKPVENAPQRETSSSESKPARPHHSGQPTPAAKTRASAPVRSDSSRTGRQPVAEPVRSVLRLSAPDEHPAPHLQLQMETVLTLPAPGSHAERMAELKAEQRRLALAEDRDEIVQRAKVTVNALRAELNILQSEIRALREEGERMQRHGMAAETAREPEGGRPFDWLLAVGALIVIALAAIAWLLWRIVRMQKATAQIPWNEFDTQQGGEPEETVFSSSLFRPTLFGPTGYYPSESDARAQASETSSVPAGPAPRTSVAGSVAPVRATQDEQSRLEEITDVMELAEAWMALNNPAKVLELLKPFSEDERPQSPLPWLCLLDVHRALGDREKYEAIRRRIRNLFNVRLASWEEQACEAETHTLADYPHVVERIVSLWNDAGLRAYLDGLLVDIRDGERDGFALPVYRDLLRLTALLDDSTCDRSRPELDPRAYDILFSMREAPRKQERTGEVPANPQPEARATEEPQPKPRIRERPKYITPSYERTLGEAQRVSSASAQQDIEQADTPGAPHQSAQEPVAAAPAVEQADAGGKEDEGDLTPVAIKLHLAVAYQDIGDTEGAALLLEEVIEHGTPEQSAQARVMLAQIA